jgi:hypothetical protein
VAKSSAMVCPSCCSITVSTFSCTHKAYQKIPHNFFNYKAPVKSVYPTIEQKYNSKVNAGNPHKKIPPL